MKSYKIFVLGILTIFMVACADAGALPTLVPTAAPPSTLPPALPAVPPPIEIPPTPSIEARVTVLQPNQLEDEPVEEPLSEVTLTGGNWHLLSMNREAPLPGTVLSAAFNDDSSLSGSAGCNDYSGNYQLFEEEISIGQLAVTNRACDPIVDAQEEAYLLSLESADSFEIRGNELILTEVDGNVDLRFVSGQSAALAGSTWSATAFNNDQEAVVNVSDGSQITAAFEDDGLLTGSAGCNNYSAPYQIGEENQIQIGSVITTQMACEPALMDQETQYLAAIETAATYELSGNILALRDGGGAIAATYQGLSEPETLSDNGDGQASGDFSPLPEEIGLELEGLAGSYEVHEIPATAFDDCCSPDPVGSPAHLLVTFDGQDPQSAISENSPRIYIFPAAPYGEQWQINGDTTIINHINQLQTILNDRPPSPAAPLPVLPPNGLENLLSVQTSYLNFANGEGLAYIGQFAQEPVPVTNENINYHFQGMTDDGIYYISLVFPINSSLLVANDNAVTGEEQAEFNSDLEAYYQSKENELNEVAPANWEPDLSSLNALVESLRIVPSEAVNN